MSGPGGMAGPMASRSVDILVTTGEPRVGGWCEQCALPSLVEIDIIGMYGEGKLAGISKLRTVIRCSNHDGLGSP